MSHGRRRRLESYSPLGCSRIIRRTLQTRDGIARCCQQATNFDRQSDAPLPRSQECHVPIRHVGRLSARRDCGSTRTRRNRHALEFGRCRTVDLTIAFAVSSENANSPRRPSSLTRRYQGGTGTASNTGPPTSVHSQRAASRGAGRLFCYPRVRSFGVAAGDGRVAVRSVGSSASAAQPQHRDCSLQDPVEQVQGGASVPAAAEVQPHRHPPKHRLHPPRLPPAGRPHFEVRLSFPPQPAGAPNL